VAGINGNRLITDGNGCKQVQKTLDFARGCKSIQNQLVTFLLFIRDREVLTSRSAKIRLKQAKPKPILTDGPIHHPRNRTLGQMRGVGRWLLIGTLIGDGRLEEMINPFHQSCFESRCLIAGLDVCAVQRMAPSFERSDVTSALASGAQGTSKSP